ncbi:MAG TPA: hypothetical protein VMS76_07095 [Planctomycetota bacterium]|nr:hypothetical protein [Planctomycetota bacterium]
MSDRITDRHGMLREDLAAAGRALDADAHSARDEMPPPPNATRVSAGTAIWPPPADGRLAHLLLLLSGTFVLPGVLLALPLAFAASVAAVGAAAVGAWALLDTRMLTAVDDAAPVTRAAALLGILGGAIGWPVAVLLVVARLW